MLQKRIIIHHRNKIVNIKKYIIGLYQYLILLVKIENQRKIKNTNDCIAIT